MLCIHYLKQPETALDNEFYEEEVSEVKEILWKVTGDVVLG